MAEGIARLVVGANPARTAVRAVVLIGAGVLLVNYGILSVRGSGPSMLPNIQDGQLMIVSRLSFRWRPPRRGELVAVHLDDDRAVLIKRIVAGPRDRLTIARGVVEVNGVALAEPYVIFRSPWQVAEFQLGPAEYFVIGDNRGMPMEMHTMGRVAAERLIGPVIW
ncbi:MAG: signal peptidase I [Acidobacteriota bacterium]